MNGKSTREYFTGNCHTYFYEFIYYSVINKKRKREGGAKQEGEKYETWWRTTEEKCRRLNHSLY